MTPPGVAHAGPVQVPFAVRAGTIVAVSWRLGRRALAASKPEWSIDAQSGSEVRLVLRVLGTGGVQAWVIDEQRGGEDRRIPLELPGGVEAAAVRVVRESLGGVELVHVDAGELISATIEVRSETARVLYARTKLFGGLGLSGGRYEPLPTAELD